MWFRRTEIRTRVGYAIKVGRVGRMEGVKDDGDI